MNDEPLDFEEFDSLFEYDGEVGTLTNKVRRSTRAPAGKSATVKGKGGRLIVRHRGQVIDAARIVWLLSTGNDPGNDGVTCINGDLLDLKSCNLALIDNADNIAIKKVATKLKTEEQEQAEQKQSVNGEVIQVKDGRFMARIAAGGGIKIVGYYETEAKALAAIGVVK